MTLTRTVSNPGNRVLGNCRKSRKNVGLPTGLPWVGAFSMSKVGDFSLDTGTPKPVSIG